MAMTKKAKALATAVNRDKLYSIDEAIGLVKSLATAKFDETIEVSPAVPRLMKPRPPAPTWLALKTCWNW